MKKVLVVAALLILPVVTFATATWTQTSPVQGKVVFTTANESAPSAATDGWTLGSCSKGISVFIAADNAATISGTGTLKVYVYNDVAAAWGEVPDLAMTPTVSGVRYQGFAGLWVASNGGRIALVPVSLGVSGGGLTVYFSCN